MIRGVRLSTQTLRRINILCYARQPSCIIRASSGRVDEREHFFCYAGIIADIGPFGEPAPKICGLGMLRRNNADRELGCRPIVRAYRATVALG